MSLRITLVVASAVLSVVASIIAIVGLVHELASARDPHMLVHGLEDWLVSAGYHLALILVATAAVYYLANKKI